MRCSRCGYAGGAVNSYPQELSTGTKNLWTTRRRYAQLIHILASNLTGALASQLAGEPLWRIARRRVLLHMGVLCLLLGSMINVSIPNAYAVSDKQIDYYKLYAHSLIIDAKQYRCVELLWDRESKWNPAAHNKSGGAYGIPQMKNKRIQYLDGFSQIRYGLKYIEHRYQTPCLAWAYWLKHRNY